jgi:hypothetical protein
MRKLTFSQRKRLKPVTRVMQIDDMNNNLRVSLWNALKIFYWDFMKVSYGMSNVKRQGQEGIELLCHHIWMFYLIKPTDTMPDNFNDRYKIIREYFFDCQWNEVYDFIEFVADHFPSEYPIDYVNRDFMNCCNEIMESEMSAYRFVNGRITQITSPTEIASVEEAMEQDVFAPVHKHLETALKMLSDRRSPDYRNSIKESISAVEALCRFITDNRKASLSDALGLMKKQKEISIHPALEQAFDKLYGYTSDEKGIRHSLFEVPDLKFEDAKFMLVSCSAFVNYLISKSSKKN